MCPTIQTALEKRLTALSPDYLEVINNSANHAGHAGAKAEGDFVGQTHFIIRIRFRTPMMTRVAAHRLIYQAVGDLMNHPIHALQIEIV